MGSKLRSVPVDKKAERRVLVFALKHLAREVAPSRVFVQQTRFRLLALEATPANRGRAA